MGEAIESVVQGETVLVLSFSRVPLATDTAIPQFQSLLANKICSCPLLHTIARMLSSVVQYVLYDFPVVAV